MPAAGFVFLMLACLLALSAAFTAPAASLIARPAAARSESPARQPGGDGRMPAPFVRDGDGLLPCER